MDVHEPGLADAVPLSQYPPLNTLASLQNNVLSLILQNNRSVSSRYPSSAPGIC